ncbi:tol-pal system YbgF family protein [Candidatus Latescibacterota bacterium]
MTKLNKYWLHIDFLALFIAVSLFSGCAYFNTFFMANRNFKLAERQYEREPTEETLLVNRTKYKDAIENAALVVRDYPESKFIDDSLFIIGVSYYRTEDYNRALIKFNEILTAFPDGEFSGEAKYYKALTFIEIQKYEDARLLLNELITGSDSRSLKGRAGLALVDIALRDKLWDELLVAAQNAIDSDPEDKTLFQAIVYKGQALFELERYEECAEAMKGLLENKLETDIKLNANLQLAFAQAKLGSFDESLEYLDNMQGKGEFADSAPYIRLQMGKMLELKGDDIQAMETYRNLAGDYPDSLSSKEAWYRVGILTLKDLSNAESAKEAFNNVLLNKASAEADWLLDTPTKLEQIDAMAILLEGIEATSEDSVKRAQTRFSLAELYTFSFDRPDSAFNQYRLIREEAPETDFAVRSEYFLGLDELRREDRYSDETDRKLMESVIEKYPESSFAQQLKVHLGLIESPPEVIAFVAAEHAMLTGEEPDVYMPMYRAVTDSFPDTKIGSQALFTMAYHYEHDVGDSDKAFELYTELSEKEETVYNKEYVQLAGDKLAHAKEEETILREIKKNIAYLIFARSEMEEESVSGGSAEADDEAEEADELTGYRKIRARNARIRSRYYTN